MADERSGSGGAAQRLWWKDEIATETTQTAPRQAEVTPIVAEIAVAAMEPTIHHASDNSHALEEDTWAELEAEAARRHATATQAESENVVIYANKSQNLARLKKRMLYFGFPMLALYTALVAAVQVASSQSGGGISALWLGPAFILVELAVLYAVIARATVAQTKPTIVLSPEGIEVHSQGHDIGLIHWSEIKEVYAYNFLYRYVGIVPHDTKALCKRLGPKRSRLIRMNAWCIPLYNNRLFRQRVAPINLAQQNLPLTADALVARIAAYEAAHRGG